MNGVSVSVSNEKGEYIQKKPCGKKDEKIRSENWREIAIRTGKNKVRENWDKVVSCHSRRLMIQTNNHVVKRVD